MRTLTDSLGRFVLRGLAGDSVRLELRGIGYRPLTLTISLRAPVGGLDLVMQLDRTVLPEIRTTARPAKPAKYLGTTKYDGFFQRQKLGLGTFISREQIERMNAVHTLEILRGVPGINVSIGNGDPTDADIRIPRCFGGNGRVTSFKYRDGGDLPRGVADSRGVPLGWLRRHRHLDSIQSRRGLRGRQARLDRHGRCAPSR